MIEVRSNEEIEKRSTSNTENCGKGLEAKVQVLRNPRLLIYNIPEENATKTKRELNSELQLGECDNVAKFIYTMKRNTRNPVTDVSSHTREQIMNTRMKIGWVKCKVNDYIQVNRYFKCSRYNHRLADCRREKTYPICTRRHKVRENTSSQNDFKCINCMTYNKYSCSKNICTNHSSLDKNCPRIQAQLTKYKHDTGY